VNYEFRRSKNATKTCSTRSTMLTNRALDHTAAAGGTARTYHNSSVSVVMRRFPLPMITNSSKGFRFLPTTIRGLFTRLTNFSSFSRLVFSMKSIEVLLLVLLRSSCYASGQLVRDRCILLCFVCYDGGTL
jgi:hypothetical protein